ncbi:MAG: hypothetical protein K8T20_19235 [Planctomycetes bacterium]|nr:hypothetical protein [Planctomycetota bacterium]
MTRVASVALLATIAVLAIGVDSAAGPRPAKRFGLRPPRHGAWQIEAPLDSGDRPDQLTIPNGHAVSRFWKCDRAGVLVAEVACFDDWPDYEPDHLFDQVPESGMDPGILPRHETTPSEANRHERNMELDYLIFETTFSRHFHLETSRPVVRRAYRRWGALSRESGIYESPNGTRWEIGVEAAILDDGSEVTLVYRMEARHARPKTRAQIEEILDSLHVLKPI